MDSIKDVVQSSVKVPEFDNHLKKAGGHIGRNVVVRKPLMIKRVDMLKNQPSMNYY